MGIKATVTVASCTGDVRARISGHLGVLDGDNLWTAIQVQPERNRIYNVISAEDPQTYESPYVLHFSAYKSPIDILGQEFNLTMLFSND